MPKDSKLKKFGSGLGRALEATAYVANAMSDEREKERQTEEALETLRKLHPDKQVIFIEKA